MGQPISLMSDDDKIRYCADTGNCTAEQICSFIRKLSRDKLKRLITPVLGQQTKFMKYLVTLSLEDFETIIIEVMKRFPDLKISTILYFLERGYYSLHHEFIDRIKYYHTIFLRELYSTDSPTIRNTLTKIFNEIYSTFWDRNPGMGLNINLLSEVTPLEPPIPLYPMLIEYLKIHPFGNTRDDETIKRFICFHIKHDLNPEVWKILNNPSFNLTKDIIPERYAYARNILIKIINHPELKEKLIEFGMIYTEYKLLLSEFNKITNALDHLNSLEREEDEWMPLPEMVLSKFVYEDLRINILAIRDKLSKLADEYMLHDYDI